MCLRYRPPWPHNQGSNEGQDLTAKGDKNVWAVHPIISFISTAYLMLMRCNLSVHLELWPNVGNVGSLSHKCIPIQKVASRYRTWQLKCVYSRCQIPASPTPPSTLSSGSPSLLTSLDDVTFVGAKVIHIESSSVDLCFRKRRCLTLIHRFST